MAGTEQAAATALSLHLNHPPARFLCWSCGDVAADGSVLRAPTVHRPHPGLLARRATDPVTGVRGYVQSTLLEGTCTGAVTVPGHARQLIAAHLQARRAQGGGDDDPFFRPPDSSVSPGRGSVPGRRAAGPPSAQFLRERVIRTCRRLNLNPPWLHRDPCKYGADGGLEPRRYGWLHERGLTLVQLDPVLGAPLVRRRPVSPS